MGFSAKSPVYSIERSERGRWKAAAPALCGMGVGRRELSSARTVYFLVSLLGVNSPIRVRLDLYRDGQKNPVVIFGPAVTFPPNFVPKPDADEPIELSTAVTPPKLVHRVEPEYPAHALRARIQGTVILEFIVGRDGGVRHVRVLRSVPLLDNAAIAAVQKWEYAPARNAGHPVSVYLTLHVKFEIPHANTPAG
jgi:TonB family protein